MVVYFLVVQAVLDPRVQAVEKTVEIPQLQIVKKVVEIPEIQTVQDTQTPESFGHDTRHAESNAARQLLDASAVC